MNPSRIGKTRIAVLEALIAGREISPKSFAEEMNLTQNRVCNVLKNLWAFDLVCRVDKSTKQSRHVIYSAENVQALLSDLSELRQSIPMDASALLAVWR